MSKKIPTIILISSLVWVCATLLIGSALAKGFKPGTEPDNFGGISWGESINSLSDMTFATEYEGAKYYKKKNDKLMIGDARLSEMMYGFYKDRFYAVIITFQGRENFERLKTNFFKAYGEGEKPFQLVEEFHWIGENVRLRLVYNEETNKGNISLYYWPITEEQLNEMPIP
jgi:hypothetical protein